MHSPRATRCFPPREPCPQRGAGARWYRGAIVWGRRRVATVERRAHGALHARASVLATASVLAAVVIASGCGTARQDAHETSGSFPVEVVRARFPAHQAIARPASFELQVRNAGEHTVPNVAVTLDSFYYTEHFPELAANQRPVWVIERGPGAIAKPPVETQEVSVPGGGQTAYVNTWALGPLARGRTQTFIWKVIPVKSGPHAVAFSVAAGLAGKARARLGSGGPAQGRVNVAIAPVPPSMHVDPSTGRVVAGLYPHKP
jgi:hypothetical protein